MMHTAFKANYWFRLSLLSLLLVAILGFIMRIKIAYTFPYFDQKHLQLAHSHLAFMAWISQALWIFIIDSIKAKLDLKMQGRFNQLIGLNFISIFLLSISLLLLGYHPLSIGFLGLQLFVSIGLIFNFFKVGSNAGNAEVSYIYNWSMVFQLLAGLGSVALVVLMLGKHMTQHQYLMATYWYLHFSYNGWFLFGILGLWQHYLISGLNQKPIPKPLMQTLIWSCLPAYGLSVLWLNLTSWFYWIVVVAAIAQAIVWTLILLHTKRELNLTPLFSQSKLKLYLLLFVCIALTVKWLLQLGSVIPAISKLAFGFRPVVIAYLHLILLGVISSFLLGYAHFNSFMGQTSTSKKGIWLFMTGVLLNELFLAIQGIASFSYTIIPYMNEGLLLAAVVLLLSTILMQNFRFQYHDNYHGN